jgi:ABC-2 type transport system ATP-binding protein
MTSMLTITGLTKRYGRVVAVDGVDLHVPKGRLVGFVGPNGAGKSTTMRSVFGLVEPDAGTIAVDGHPVDGATLRRVGYMPEQRGLYPKMPVGQQVEFFARLKGMEEDARSATRDLLEEVGLGDRIDDPLDALSHGNQQRVQLAVALVHRPDLLLLDEPFNGLDPVAVQLLQDRLVDRSRQGVGVLFSSHQLDLVERLCTDVVIIVDGKVRAAGPLEEVRKRAGRTLEVVVDRPLTPVPDTLAAVLPERATVLDATTRSARVSLEDDRALGAVLPALQSAGGDLARFSFGPPSLADVFVQIVGRTVDELERAHDNAPAPQEV